MKKLLLSILCLFSFTSMLNAEEKLYKYDENFNYELGEFVLVGEFVEEDRFLLTSITNQSDNYLCMGGYSVYSDLEGTKYLGGNMFETYFSKNHTSTVLDTNNLTDETPMSYRIDISCDSVDIDYDNLFSSVDEDDSVVSSATDNDDFVNIIIIIIISSGVIFITIFAVCIIRIIKSGNKKIDSELFKQVMSNHEFLINEITSHYENANYVLKGINNTTEFIFFDMKDKDSTTSLMESLNEKNNENGIGVISHFVGADGSYTTSTTTKDKYYYLKKKENILLSVVADKDNMKSIKKIIKELY